MPVSLHPSAVSGQPSGVTHQASGARRHAPRTTHHASRPTHHASRITPHWAIPLLAVLIAPGLAGQAPSSLTIYSDGRTLVRWIAPGEVPKGQSRQVAATGPADPGSIFSLDPELTIMASAYDAGIDELSVLRRAVGREVRYRSGRDTITATILGVDPVRYRMSDGSVGFSAPGAPLYPAELVTVNPSFELTVQSARARHGLPLGYFTDGASWSARYQVILGQGGMGRVQAQAVISGGPLRMAGVEIQLLAGQVNVAAPAPYARRRDEMMVGAMAAREMAVPAQQKVGEFHLYTLPGSWSLEPGIIRTIALFEPVEARVTRSFEVRGQIPYWGGLPQNGQEEEPPVAVVYTVARPRKTPFGELPVPGGVVRLFQPDSGGRVQLIGEAAIDHSPAGEDLRLDAGTAFDLTAKRVQTTYTTRRDSTPEGRWRTIATADYRVTLSNAATEAAVVDVIEERGGEWAVVSSSLKAEKLSSTRTRFRVPVAAGGKATLTYRVRIIW